MVLSIIALILSLAVLGYSIKGIADDNKKLKELEDEIRAVAGAYSSLKSELKEISIDGLEGVKYDHKTTTMTIDGNLVVKGGVSAGGITVKE